MSTRFLHLRMSSDLVTQANVTARELGLTVDDFVTEIVMADLATRRLPTVRLSEPETTERRRRISSNGAP